ncbi:hypothetical protein DB346_14850 [Verrucomicrobia bacterium LW23]|nr:hypothetical protein DB346_14850 [Verrucomicrobia bacterium LW23]
MPQAPRIDEAEYSIVGTCSWYITHTTEQKRRTTLLTRRSTPHHPLPMGASLHSLLHEDPDGLVLVMLGLTFVVLAGFFLYPLLFPRHSGWTAPRGAADKARHKDNDARPSPPRPGEPGSEISIADTFNADLERLNLRIDREPKDAEAFAERGRVHLVARDYPAAQYDLTRALELGPNGTLAALSGPEAQAQWLFATRYHLAATLIGLRQPREALEQLDAAVAVGVDIRTLHNSDLTELYLYGFAGLPISYVAVLQYRAMVRWYQDDNAGSLDDMRQACNIMLEESRNRLGAHAPFPDLPDSETLVYLRAAVALDEGNFEAAARDFFYVAHHNRGSAEYWHHLIAMALLAGKPQHAVDVANGAVKLLGHKGDLQSMGVHMLRAVVHRAVGKTERAIEELDYLSTYALPELPHLRGDTWLQSAGSPRSVREGQDKAGAMPHPWREALADYAAAAQRDPNDADARLKSALIHRAAGDLTQALAELDATLSIAPCDYVAMMFRASTRTALGDTPGAAADIAELKLMCPRLARMLEGGQAPDIAKM